MPSASTRWNTRKAGDGGFDAERMKLPHDVMSVGYLHCYRGPGVGTVPHELAGEENVGLVVAHETFHGLQGVEPEPLTPHGARRRLSPRCSSPGAVMV